MASSNTPPSGGTLAAMHSLPKELRNLIAGGLAGMIAKSIVAPIDRIKILYQVTSAQFRLRDVPRVAGSIIEKEGAAALWKGNTATMIRVFPYSGIQFMVFDYCKLHFLGEENNDKRRRRQPTKSYEDVRGASISHRGTVARQSSVPKGNSGDKKGGLTPMESLISGMIAGTISVLCTYPLDLARAQLAVLRKQKKPTPGTTVARTAPNPNCLNTQLGIGAAKPSKKGIGYVLTNSFRRSGAPGLYRGITPTILGILPYSGVAFTINEQAKRRITHYKGREPTTVERLQCGALSGLFAQTLAYPLEVTRRRMQTIGIVPTSGAESAAVNFTGVAGLRPSADELPAEASRRLTAAGASAGENVGPSVVGNGSGTGSATSAAAAPTTSQHPPAATPTTPQQHPKPPSMMTTMRHLLEEQGLRGFYKGVSMNWVKGPIAFSISFTAFDTIQGWIETDVEKERKRKLARISISRRLTNNED